jgi:hypothetical protein
VAKRGLRSVRIGSLNPHILDSQKVVKGIFYKNGIFRFATEKAFAKTIKKRPFFGTFDSIAGP